jgi:hypothetical protein
MHLHKKRGARSDRVRIIRKVRAIRRPDLDELGTGLAHDVGHPECAPDLDELAARHDDFAPCRQNTEHQQHRRRVVVDHRCSFGAGQFAQQLFDERVAFAAPTRCKIKFQVDWRAHAVHDRAYGRLRQDRTTQIGMQYGTRQIEHGTQARLCRRDELCLEHLCDRSFIHCR